MQSEEEEGSIVPSAQVKKAAAAMAVGVGSFKDPDHLQVLYSTCLPKVLVCPELPAGLHRSPHAP